MKSRLWIGLAIALIGCSQTDWAALTPGPTAAEQANTEDYGGAGQLSAEEWAALRSLAWPQDYSDMKGSFGFPAWRNETADVYVRADGAEIWVFYEGRQATRYEVR